MSNLRLSINLVLNDELQSAAMPYDTKAITTSMVQTAAERLDRFAPLLAYLFPELEKSQGIIESSLIPLKALNDYGPADGFWLKGDHDLAVAGSVKARGGIHEVLELVDLINEKHFLMPNNSVIDLLSERSLEILGKYKVTVGSTGNLGMSVGIMGAALGMQAVVHMSAEARSGKSSVYVIVVRRLLSTMVIMQAVAQGRTEALADAFNHFVDDEHSLSLFCGYAVAGRRLKAQTESLGIRVDAEHPLFVYIPCGVVGRLVVLLTVLSKSLVIMCMSFVEPEDSSCFAVQIQNQISQILVFMM